MFKDMAVIRAGGGEQLLRKSARPLPQGVTLDQCGLPGKPSLPGAAYAAYAGPVQTGGRSVCRGAGFGNGSIPADDLGQYRIRGAINNHYVDFLVDTGASVVALSSAQADALGINYEAGSARHRADGAGQCGVLLHEPARRSRWRVSRPTTCRLPSSPVIIRSTSCSACRS